MMRLCYPFDVHETVEMRDGAIFRTKKIGRLWIPLNELGKVPKQMGNLHFIPSSDQPERKEI